MSLHYILDGYNVLKQVSQFSNRKLKDGRVGLIRLLKTSRQLQKQKITIVFDGTQDSESKTIGGNLEILFTGKSNADEKIKRIVERSPTARRIIVVSDDKEIRFFVRSLRAQVLSVSAFLNWILAKEKIATYDKSRESEAYDKNLKYDEVVKINRELKKIWFKDTDNRKI